ncbi:MAG: hypothetical protein WAV56_00960 [Microgenomates group bacterium]
MPSPETEIRKYPDPTAEGVALATAISQIHIIPIAQTALTLTIHEQLRQVQPEVMGEIALGVFVATLLLGYLYEVDTLKKLGLTSNPLTVLTYFKIKNPELATVIGDLTGQILHTFNPVDISYIIASFSSQDSGHAFFSNLIARSVLGFGFVTGFNWALRQGHADKIVAQIHELRQRAADKLTEFELAICPLPQTVDYLDNTSGDFHAWRVSTPPFFLLK